MKINTLITGATKGIGKSIANHLLQKNHNIINLSKSGIIPDEFKKYNKSFKSYKIDISDFENTFLYTKKLIENKQIDNVILNSGITKDKLFHKLTLENWLSVLNTNLLSSYGILNPIINQMRTNKKGNVIFISSVNAHRGVIGQTNYSSSKYGIIALNRCLALENANYNINCNVISPGYIETDMLKKINNDIKIKIEDEIPMKRFGQPEDLLDTLDLLLLKNSYITGSNIDINGGLFMK